MAVSYNNHLQNHTGADFPQTPKHFGYFSWVEIDVQSYVFISNRCSHIFIYVSIQTMNSFLYHQESPHPLRPLSMSPKHFRPLNQGFQLSNLLCLTWQSHKSKRKDHRPIVMGKWWGNPWLLVHIPLFRCYPMLYLCFFAVYCMFKRTSAMRKTHVDKKSVLVCGRNCSRVKAAILVGKWW